MGVRRAVKGRSAYRRSADGINAERDGMGKANGRADRWAQGGSQGNPSPSHVGRYIRLLLLLRLWLGVLFGQVDELDALEEHLNHTASRVLREMAVDEVRAGVNGAV